MRSSPPAYLWDGDGNLVQKSVGGQVTGYCMDAENQLTKVVLPGGGTVTYKYDGLGRRIETNSAGTITRYIYDGRDIWATYDGANTLKDRMLHGLGIDEPMRLDRGGLSYFYLGDRLGSVGHLADANGAIQQSYKYDAFGNIVSQTGSVNQPFTYTGREWDAAAGLYYYRARYYDPAIGRFISEDPIGFVGGINFYSYVRNNSTNLVDPFGLDPAGGIMRPAFDLTCMIALDSVFDRRPWSDKLKHCTLICTARTECATEYEQLIGFLKEYLWDANPTWYVYRRIRGTEPNSQPYWDRLLDSIRDLLANYRGGRCADKCKKGGKSCEQCCREYYPD